MTTEDTDRMLSTNEAAAHLNLKPDTLRQWRYRGCSPPFYRVGNGPGARCHYLASELKEWLSNKHLIGTCGGGVPVEATEDNR
jgi:hypothetical protein